MNPFLERSLDDTLHMFCIDICVDAAYWKVLLCVGVVCLIFVSSLSLFKCHYLIGFASVFLSMLTIFFPITKWIG